MTEIKKSSKSSNQVERELGYSRNALHNYKNGTEPSGSRLIELSQYFGIPADYLIGKSEKAIELSPEKLFHKLNTEEKLKMWSICQSWALWNLRKKK